MATRLNLWWFTFYLFILLVFLLFGLYKFLGGSSIYPLDNAVEITPAVQDIEGHNIGPSAPIL